MLLVLQSITCQTSWSFSFTRAKQPVCFLLSSTRVFLWANIFLPKLMKIWLKFRFLIKISAIWRQMEDPNLQPRSFRFQHYFPHPIGRSWAHEKFVIHHSTATELLYLPREHEVQTTRETISYSFGKCATAPHSARRPKLEPKTSLFRYIL